MRHSFVRAGLFGGSLVVSAFFQGAGPAQAFHDGGVGHCSGCHTMHNSQDGGPLNLDAPGGTEGLLLHANPTDLCLSCHATANGAVFGSDPLNPPPERGAGNFVFLLEDQINDAPDGMAHPIDGNHAGHNVESFAWGIPADLDHPVAPGGTYASEYLTCISCHDPHGGAGAYRMLRGAGSTDPSGFTFTEAAPTALGIDLDGPPESVDNHAAYHEGWAEWCGNCHGRFHDEGDTGFEHPEDHSMGDEWQTYNRYDGPDQTEGGTVATAYLPEVPIEDPALTTKSSFGARGASRVMCLSCHRAHATSAPKALRWDPNVEFLAEDGFVSGSYPIPSPYPEPDQRALCVKCHWSEASDHGFGRACMECHRESH